MSSAAPMRVLVALALPMVLARATQAVVTFADAIQVKHLGASSLAATATGGLNFLGLVILPMGTVFIVQSFVSQLVGRGEHAEAPRYAWYALAIAAIAAVFTVAVIPLIEPALGLTGYSPGVQTDMSRYIEIRILSVGAIVGVEALGNWYGGLGNTWMQMIAGIITMTVNIVLNWLLIDGNLGAPALGVAGAAWASMIASWCGFAFLALAFWRRWGGAPRTAKGHGRLSRGELWRVVKFGLPNGFNWFLEFAAFQLFVNGVLASLGDETVAALNVVLAVNSISFMPAFGLASAGAILAGQAIGRDDKDAVWPQVKVTLAVTAAWMGLIGGLYLISPSWVLSLFEEPGKSGDLVAIGTGMLAISAAWQLFDAVCLTFAETLRAAGDTAWTMAARILLAWAVFTPAAFIVVNVLDGGAIGAMICLVAYIALLSVALALRFRSGAWRKIELIEPALV
ncbi:MAG: MATE family efflux transporter [Deltaproteobacteria bacterium]|nr:MATE family efflux transporter [Deltaproteobacteria bacterium]